VGAECPVLRCVLTDATVAGVRGLATRMPLLDGTSKSLTHRLCKRHRANAQRSSSFHVEKDGNCTAPPPSNVPCLHALVCFRRGFLPPRVRGARSPLTPFGTTCMVRRRTSWSITHAVGATGPCLASAFSSNLIVSGRHLACRISPATLDRKQQTLISLHAVQLGATFAATNIPRDVLLVLFSCLPCVAARRPCHADSGFPTCVGSADEPAHG
jgi:hypothetical protein